MIGKDPLPPEILGASGLPLGTEVWLPATFVVVSNPASQPVPQGQISATEQALGRGEPDYNETEATGAAGETSAGGKAKLHGPRASMRQLRGSVEARKIPQIKGAVAAFLDAQKREIVALVRQRAGHLAKKPGDQAAWWNGKQWDQRLRAALAGHLGGIAETVADHVREVLPVAGKADPVGQDLKLAVVKRVLDRGAARVTAINEITRDEITKIIAAGVAEEISPGALGDLIEASTVFDEYRAELIARTELVNAYNGAAIDSYREVGIEKVEAVDGDGDEECAARDGQIFDADEAEGIEDHPNGTLDWIPVIA